MIEKLLKLTRRLFPTGRAFRIPSGSDLEALFRALAESERDAFEAATDDVLNSILPDNDQFQDEAADAWERRLAITPNELNPIETRRAIIQRKYSQPFTQNRAKLSRQRIESALQSVGFNVQVYNNLNGDVPTDVANLTTLKHAATTIHGSTTAHGAPLGITKIANHVREEDDEDFVIADFKQTFFIGGPLDGGNQITFATIDLDRKEEFRELVCILKPKHAVALTFINFEDTAGLGIMSTGFWNDNGVLFDDLPFFPTEAP